MHIKNRVSKFNVPNTMPNSMPKSYKEARINNKV